MRARAEAFICGIHNLDFAVDDGVRSEENGVLRRDTLGWRSLLIDYRNLCCGAPFKCSIR